MAHILTETDCVEYALGGGGSSGGGEDEDEDEDDDDQEGEDEEQSDSEGETGESCVRQCSKCRNCQAAQSPSTLSCFGSARE